MQRHRQSHLGPVRAEGVQRREIDLDVPFARGPVSLRERGGGGRRLDRGQQRQDAERDTHGTPFCGPPPAGRPAHGESRSPSSRESRLQNRGGPRSILKNRLTLSSQVIWSQAFREDHAKLALSVASSFSSNQTTMV